jgi:hypothetical protein
MRVKSGLRRVSLSGALSLMTLLLLPPALRAQVAGMVRDSASQLPLPNTAVIVLDPAGRPVSRSVTDQQGRFRLATSPTAAKGRAAPKTTYPLRLRVLRMGFRPKELPLTAASAGTYWDIGLVSFPIQLEEVQIVALTCPQRPDRKQALGLLRQVRMSLLANVVARSQSSATMQRLLFERRFEGASGSRIASQTVRRRVTSSTTEAFSAARSAAAFSRQGFIEDSTGAHAYVGPDAETLLDDAFAERYCFKVAPPDRTRPLQVGLGFEPVDREDGRIDIIGTVWVDTLSRVLRDMDFHYVGLDPQTSALSPEGRLSFRELSNGVVIIDQWSLRLSTERRPAGRTLAGRTPVVSATSGTTRDRPQEIGGEIARASWPDGYSWEAPLGTIRLRAVDGQGRPASGSVVQLLDTDYRATTDASGTFVLNDLLPGPYIASVRDPRLAALDVPSTTTLRVSAVRDSTVDARVVVESAEDYVIKRCGYDAGILAGRGRLLGRVMRGDGQPAADARFTMRDEFGTVMVESGRADAEGFFTACQIPLNKSVTIDVWQGDKRTNASSRMTDPLTTLRVALPQ